MILTLPLIGADSIQSIIVTDKLDGKYFDKTDYNKNTYYANLDCDEGIDKTRIFLVTGPNVAYTCMECHETSQTVKNLPRELPPEIEAIKKY